MVGALEDETMPITKGGTGATTAAVAAYDVDSAKKTGIVFAYDAEGAKHDCIIFAYDANGSPHRITV